MIKKQAALLLSIISAEDLHVRSDLFDSSYS